MRGEACGDAADEVEVGATAVETPGPLPAASNFNFGVGAAASMPSAEGSTPAAVGAPPPPSLVDRPGATAAAGGRRGDGCGRATAAD